MVYITDGEEYMHEMKRTGWIVGLSKRTVMARENIGTKNTICVLSLLVVLLKSTRN